VFEFGMEVFEDGKLLEGREVWNLLCQYPSANGDQTKTYCGLEVKRFLKSTHSTIVTADTYGTVDGTIKIKQVDWKAGTLDFSILLIDKTATEVSLFASYDKENIYLKSFRAVNVGRSIGADKLSVIEYKIPAYTYTLNYPVEIKGLKSR